MSPNGIITTVAGNGTTAILNWPTGIAVDASGNLFIADTGNNRIRRSRSLRKYHHPNRQRNGLTINPQALR